jgi:glutamyl-tRNA synthetase
VLAAMSGLKERAKTLIELADGMRFILADRPLRLDQKAQALLNADARTMLCALKDELAKLDDWTAASTEGAIRGFTERTGAKLGNIAQPLRAALTGRTTSPPIFDVMVVLGKNETLARLGDQLSLVAANS